MPLSDDAPIPLILEQLQGTTGWQAIEERIKAEIERCNGDMIALTPDASAAACQRIIGQMEGLKFVLRQPQAMRARWQRAQQKDKTNTTGANE
jgi:hypothetical protein